METTEKIKRDLALARRRYTSYGGTHELRGTIDMARATDEEARESGPLRRAEKVEACLFCGEWIVDGECGADGEGVCVVRAAVEDGLAALSPHAMPAARRTWLNGYALEHEMSRDELRLANDAIDAALGPWDAKRARRALDVLRTLVGPTYDPRRAASEHATIKAPWLAAIVDRVRDALGVLVADPKNLELAAVREARKARP